MSAPEIVQDHGGDMSGMLNAAQSAIVGAPPNVPEGVEWPEIRYEIHDLGELPFTGDDGIYELTRNAGHENRRRDVPDMVGYAAVVKVAGEERPGQRWYALVDGAGMWAATREDAEAEIARRVAFSAAFWMEKVGWRLAGDVAPGDNHWRHRHNPRPVIRSGGIHYVIGHEPSASELESNRRYGGLGMGGSQMAFGMLATGEVVQSRNVWYQGHIPAEFRDLLPDNAESVVSDDAKRMAEAMAKFRKDWEAKQKARAELRGSLAPFSAAGREHPLPDQVLMHVENMDEDYDDAVGDVRTATRDLDTATVMTSAFQGYAGDGLGDDWHRPVLDIDMNAELLPSSTPGHFHLFIDRPMRWETYVKLIEALAEAEILEPGYAKASVERGHTAVRLPWVKKGQGTQDEQSSPLVPAGVTPGPRP